MPSSEQLAMYSTVSSKQISFTADLCASMRFTCSGQAEQVKLSHHAVWHSR